MKDDHKKYVFFIDRQKFESSEAHLTVRQILTDFAKVNPDENILVMVHGNEMKELRNLDESIELHEGMKFTIFNQKPTPVS
jgi:hypothetical protein